MRFIYGNSIISPNDIVAFIEEGQYGVAYGLGHSAEGDVQFFGTIGLTKGNTAVGIVDTRMPPEPPFIAVAHFGDRELNYIEKSFGDIFRLGGISPRARPNVFIEHGTDMSSLLSGRIKLALLHRGVAETYKSIGMPMLVFDVQTGLPVKAENMHGLRPLHHKGILEADPTNSEQALRLSLDLRTNDPLPNAARKAPEDSHSSRLILWPTLRL